MFSNLGMRHQFSHQVYNISPISRTLISKRNTQIPPNISISASFSSQCAAVPILHCCRTSVASIEEEKSHTTRIFVKGLSQSIAEGFLSKIFSRFGKVNRVKVIMDKKAVQSLGFAYVWFTKEDAALSAVKEMDGKFFSGRFIAVTIARPESPSSHVRITPCKF